MQVDQRIREFIVGVSLAVIWAMGLFEVLNIASLTSKALILTGLAPLSLALDFMVSRWLNGDRRRLATCKIASDNCKSQRHD